MLKLRISYFRHRPYVLLVEYNKLKRRLQKIKELIEAIDHRCLAYDGPVPPTKEEITDEELRQIYELAGGIPEE